MNQNIKKKLKMIMKKNLFKEKVKFNADQQYCPSEVSDETQWFHLQYSFICALKNSSYGSVHVLLRSFLNPLVCLWLCLTLNRLKQAQILLVFILSVAIVRTVFFEIR